MSPGSLKAEDQVASLHFRNYRSELIDHVQMLHLRCLVCTFSEYYRMGWTTVVAVVPKNQAWLMSMLGMRRLGMFF